MKQCVGFLWMPCSQNVMAIVSLIANLIQSGITQKNGLEERLYRSGWPVEFPVDLVLIMLINIRRSTPYEWHCPWS